jgi:hypothetical protein
MSPGYSIPLVDISQESERQTIVVTTTYGHWTKGEEAYIVSVRFSLEELDAKLART